MISSAGIFPLNEKLLVIYVCFFFLFEIFHAWEYRYEHGPVHMSTVCNVQILFVAVLLFFRYVRSMIFTLLFDSSSWTNLMALFEHCVTNYTTWQQTVSTRIFKNECHKNDSIDFLCIFHEDHFMYTAVDNERRRTMIIDLCGLSNISASIIVYGLKHMYSAIAFQWVRV